MEVQSHSVKEAHNVWGRAECFLGLVEVLVACRSRA